MTQVHCGDRQHGPRVFGSPREAPGNLIAADVICTRCDCVIATREWTREAWARRIAMGKPFPMAGEDMLTQYGAGAGETGTVQGG